MSGGLADLELGPFARNIMGGREAAQRITQAYKRLSAQHIQNMHNFIRSNCQRNNYKLFLNAISCIFLIAGAGQNSL